MLQLSLSQKRPAARRGGFTLIEILVAVAIMSLLLGIILVPLRLGFDTYHIGKARAEVQQEAQLTMQQIGTDLLRAKFIFPNSVVPNVNNSDPTSPCSSARYRPDGGWNFRPYSKATTAPAAQTASDPTVAGANFAQSDGWTNPARIDMLITRRNNTNGLSSDVGEDYVVTYYSRRLRLDRPYDIVDNPVVLYRAQYPYRFYSTATPSGFQVFPRPMTSAPNAELDWTQYPDLGSGANADVEQKYQWIKHNFYGEANLAPLCVDAPTGTVAGAVPVAGAHTLATPLGMSLVAPRDANINSTTPADQAEALVPELAFTQEATTGSRINRVRIDMTLAQYDQAGAGSVNGQGKAQRVHVSQTFDLPNAGCSP